MSRPFSALVLRMIHDLGEGYDVFIEIDSNDKDRHGPVGTSKSALAAWAVCSLAATLNGMARQLGYKFRKRFIELDSGRLVTVDTPFFIMLVVKDNLKAYRDAIRLNRFGKIIWIDEVEWFLHSEFHSNREVKAQSPQFMSNRKEGGVYVTCSPLIWKLVDFFRDSRIQQRWRIEKRGVVTVFDRAGMASNAPKKDAWGSAAVRYRFPKPGAYFWEWYEDTAVHHECKAGCVSALPTRSW